jgi:hypothetical protein
LRRDFLLEEVWVFGELLDGHHPLDSILGSCVGSAYMGGQP